MDELVEVEDVVADNHRKTTKFGGSERGREKDLEYIMSSQACCS